MENERPKRGRPRMTEEEKRIARKKRETGELPKSVHKDKINYGFENALPGDNSKYLAHAMAVMSMPPIETKDVKQVEKRVQEYFMLCVDNDIKPTVKGLCNALRIGRSTLFDWKKGRFRGDTHQAVVCRAHDLLEELWEDYMLNGKVNPVSGIFLGKNNFGYRDQQEISLAPTVAQPYEALPAEVIEAKYDLLPDED